MKQQKLDSLASALKQIEAYNEQMNGEIAVKRREAYATEEAVQKLEKAKMEQDYLIDGLQETMKSLQAQLELYTEQLASQKRETRAAQETLAEAESEMQAVHFEKKQLLAQWQSSVAAVRKCVCLCFVAGGGDFASLRPPRARPRPLLPPLASSPRRRR